jgi:Protein of unknown function (DUF3180)
MGPTRKRDLTAAALGTAAAGYLLVVLLYRWFPPITIWTGLSLLAVGVAEAGWGRYVRTKISDGEIGDGPGWLHPLSVAQPRRRQGVGLGRSVGVGLVGRGAGVLVAPAVMAQGGERRHHRDGGRGHQRAGSGDCWAVVATLLQIARGSDRER